MKKIYLMLFMAFSIGVYAQDTIDFRNLKNDEITGFKLYPNPATANVVYVTTDKNDTKEIRIYDVFGELVLTDRISSKLLNISRLSPGVYVVQVTENGKSINRKLVVK
ncbi:MAG: T9SS type A sorting domain-containing protein [Maribacter sp.]